jgi:hypothetical protein
MGLRRLDPIRGVRQRGAPASINAFALAGAFVLALESLSRLTASAFAAKPDREAVGSCQGDHILHYGHGIPRLSSRQSTLQRRWCGSAAAGVVAFGTRRRSELQRALIGVVR